jgi:signal transduction histidine kinase
MQEGGTLTFSTSGATSGADGEVIINISDTGTGISKKEINDIFKPFFTTKERGVGLGLAICQKIIKEHGGQIRVKSIPAQGTAFIIKLKTAG